MHESAVAQRVTFIARAVASVVLVTTCVLAFVVNTEGRRAGSVSDSTMVFACCTVLLFPIFVTTGLFWWAAPGLSSRSRGKILAAWTSLGGVIGVFGVLATFFCAWIGDWGGIKTGSSTAGLAFLFLPAYALAAGLLCAVAGLVVGAAVAYRRQVGSA